MTYGDFLLVFLVPPLLLATWWWRARLEAWLLVTLALLSLVAVVYTGPWDDQIIIHGVWSYGQGKVSGVLIGHVPIEEYGFYVLQVLLAGIVTVAALQYAERRRS